MANAICVARLGPCAKRVYGSLPVGVDCDVILPRALPEQAGARV